MFKKLLLVVSLLATASAYAGDCICFHYSLDKDTGYQLFEGSHETECGSHTQSDSLRLNGPMFERGVLQHILAHAEGPAGRVMADPSRRKFEWYDKDVGGVSCKVPDLTRQAETQPARVATAGSIITFSLAALSSERADQARLAINGWNRAFAGAGRKTRLLEVSTNANLRIYSGDLTKLTAHTFSNVVGVTMPIDESLKSHPDWPIPSTAIFLNSQFDAKFAADPMKAVQTFGHEVGHALGLADVIGLQLMSGSAHYTTDDGVIAAMAYGEYEPNLCEVAKASDNGLP